MRYTLVRFKGEPTQTRPDGLLEVVGQSIVKGGRVKAMAYLRPAADRARAYLKSGYTHYGLYESPPGTSHADNPLVHSEEIKP